MDYIGVINLRRNLPPEIASIPQVREYIKKVNVMHMTEEERLKFWIQEQNRAYEKQQQELKQKEKELEDKMKDLIDLEKQMTKKQAEYEKLNEQIEETQKDMDELKEKKENISEGIKTEQLNDLAKMEKLRQLATIYEKMDPNAAGQTFNDMDNDLAIEILMLMKESKAAEVMNNINPEKVKDLAEKLKTKGAWKSQ
jgi:flagellar motility protein MotE (MotC chaperone)